MSTYGVKDDMRVGPVLDRPPHDEIGPDPDEIERCDACGEYYRTEGWHRCPEGDHVGDVPEEVLEG